jgi:ATP-dependent Clp protease ATP-binding subunit ClpA
MPEAEMFERFARAAREAVVDAHARAQAEHAPGITDDHVLAALLTGPQAAQLLPAVGLTPDDAVQILADVAAARRRGGLTAADAEALAGLGIDLDEVLAAVERQLGAGALAPAARRRGRSRLRASRGFQQVLGSAVRRARASGDRELRPEHLLLALVGRRDPIAEALAARGVTAATVLEALDRARRGAA